MLFQKHFLAKLKEFGLNSYESKLWAALLSRGVSTAGELSDIANVPRSRSYDVLESLEKKGFIIMKLGKPIKYVAVPPEEVVERVKKHVKEDSESQVQMLEELKGSKTIEELKTLHTQGVDLIEPTDLSGCLKGRNSFYNHLDMLIKNAAESVVLATTSEGFLRKTKALANALRKAKGKGVKIRILTPATNEVKQAAKDVKQYADVRFVPSLNSRFCAIDGKQACFSILSDKDVHPTYDSAVWLHSEILASTLEKYFEHEWKAAQA